METEGHLIKTVTPQEICVEHLELTLNKAEVINDPLGQPHSLASSDYSYLLFCFARFEKWGRTDKHVRKQLSLRAVTVGWPSGSILE